MWEAKRHKCFPVSNSRKLANCFTFTPHAVIVVTVGFQRFPRAPSLEEMWVWLFPLADQRTWDVVTRVSEYDSSWITDPQDPYSLSTTAITWTLWAVATGTWMTDTIWCLSAYGCESVTSGVTCFLLLSSVRHLNFSSRPIVAFEAFHVTVLCLKKWKQPEYRFPRGTLGKIRLLLYALLNTGSIFLLWSFDDRHDENRTSKLGRFHTGTRLTAATILGGDTEITDEEERCRILRADHLEICWPSSCIMQ